jgi:hypothetical protein
MTDLPPEWTFEATVIGLNGIRVTTTVTVPADAAWSSVMECSELAQMGAAQTATRVIKTSQEEPPF